MLSLSEARFVCNSADLTSCRKGSYVKIRAEERLAGPGCKKAWTGFSRAQNLSSQGKTRVKGLCRRLLWIWQVVKGGHPSTWSGGSHLEEGW